MPEMKLVENLQCTDQNVHIKVERVYLTLVAAAVAEQKMFRFTEAHPDKKWDEQLKLEVFVHSMEMEDGSGYNFNVRGYLTDKATPFKGVVRGKDTPSGGLEGFIVINPPAGELPTPMPVKQGGPGPKYVEVKNQQRCWELIDGTMEEVADHLLQTDDVDEELVRTACGAVGTMKAFLNLGGEAPKCFPEMLKGLAKRLAQVPGESERTSIAVAMAEVLGHLQAMKYLAHAHRWELLDQLEKMNRWE